MALFIVTSKLTILSRKIDIVTSVPGFPLNLSSTSF